MPIYDFECLKCHNTFETIRKIEEDNKDLTCPKCGGKKLHKLVSSFQTHSWSQFLDNMEKKISPEKFK